MEAEVTVTTRKEVRRRKMMEHLAAKGSSARSLPGEARKPLKNAKQITRGKENEAPSSVTESKKVVCWRPVLSVRSSAAGQQQKVVRVDAPKNKTLPRTSSVPTQWKIPPRVVVESHRPPIPLTSRINLGPIVTTRTGLTPALIVPQNRRTIATAAVRGDKSAVRGDKSAVRGEKPAVRGEKSAVRGEKPTVRGEKPAVRGEKPAVRGEKPAVRGEKPAVRGEKSVIRGEKSTVRGDKSAAGQQRPGRSSTLPLSKSSSTALASKTEAPRPAGRPQGQTRPLWQRPQVSQPASKPKSTSQRTLVGSKVSHPLNDPKKPRSETVSSRNPQLKSAPSRTGLMPTGRPASRSTFTCAPVEQRGRPKPRVDAGSKKPLAPARAPPQVAAAERKNGSTTTGKPFAANRAKASPAAQAVPTGSNGSTVQTERIRKLQEWREARGISYKRPSMHAKPARVRRTLAAPESFWATMKEEEEVHGVISAVDGSLADCIKLLREGCCPDRVKEIIHRLPAVSQKFAKFWVCRALLMELDGNLDVLPMFEEAVGLVLEPVDELRKVVFDILKKRDERKEADEEHSKSDDPMVTPPKAVGARIYGERGNSSVVKFKITATPGQCPPSQQKEPIRVDGQEVRFFTPVRRSVRIEGASGRYPAALQDHDPCVSSFSDALAEESDPLQDHQDRLYVYRENEALEDRVTVQLIYEDRPPDEPASC